MRATIVTRKQLAEALGISPNRVSELHKAGILLKNEDGTYNLEDNQSRYNSYRTDTPDTQDILIAKARLTSERAKQTFVSARRLSDSLLRREFVEAFHGFMRKIVQVHLDYFAQSAAESTVGAQDVSDVGVALAKEVGSAQEKIYADLEDSVSRIQDLFPVSGLDLIDSDERPEEPISTLEPQDQLRDARLEKLRWLTRYETLRTGVMTGDYIPSEAADVIFGRIVINTKSKLHSIPGTLSPRLIGKDAQGALELIQEAAAEVLVEARLFDSDEYQRESKGFILTLREEQEESQED